MKRKYKFCSNCKQIKTATCFYKSKHKKDGLYSNCKECQKTCVKSWINRNRDKHYVYVTNWARKNVEKVREISRNSYRRRIKNA
jgi:flavoprotein